MWTIERLVDGETDFVLELCGTLEELNKNLDLLKQGYYSYTLAHWENCRVVYFYSFDDKDLLSIRIQELMKAPNANLPNPS